MKTTTDTSRIRVFFVDDHPIVRRGFQLLLGTEPDLTLCGEADSGSVALDKILALKPDVAIVDLSLQDGSGLELIRQLREQSSRAKLLVFSMHTEETYAERALRAGADGYVTKDEGTEKAIQAIRSLMQGKPYVSEKLAASMMKRVVGKPAGTMAGISSLSNRELEVLELIGSGLGSREVSQRLRLSIKTIESHREHIKTKLCLKTSPELLKYAFCWVHRDAINSNTE